MKPNIQPSQKYRTRNGCTALIIETDAKPGEVRVITARIEGDTHLGQPVAPYEKNYTEGGREYLPIGKQVQEDSPYDLIELIATTASPSTSEATPNCKL